MAVNRLSRKERPSQLRLVKGIISSKAPTRITATKHRAMVWAGESVILFLRKGSTPLCNSFSIIIAYCEKNKEQ